MRRTSVRELHINTSELVREAEQGGIIVIERRGQPVAELRPVSERKRPSRADVERMIAEADELSKKMRRTNSVDHMISEDRDR